MPVKVVLCGQPNTGKSCLREGLKRAILAKDLDYPYPYCLPANPDGDGAWFLEAVRAHPEQAIRYREIIKPKTKEFSPEFIELTAKWVEKCQLPLVFVDIGGRPDENNLKISSKATHAVILWKEAAELKIWKEFCDRAKLTVIAEIQSDYFAEEDRLGSVDAEGVLRGLVHHLDRKVPAQDRPVVQALAQHVLKHTGKKPASSIVKSAYLLTPGASSGDTLVVSTAFARPASNPEIVRSAIEAMADILKAPPEFRTLLFDGPISVLAASALAWQAAGRFAVIGVFDPKASHYVVVYASKEGGELEWKPAPGAVVDFGPMPKAPKTIEEGMEDKRIFFVRGMTQQGDTTRVEVGPGDQNAETFEMVSAALKQLAVMPRETPGLMFDGKMPVIVAAALTCAAMQRFDYVAFLDPRLKRFVVSASKVDLPPAGMLL